MDKDAVSKFLTALNKGTNWKEHLIDVRSRKSFLHKWDQETLEAIVEGIMLWHYEPGKFKIYLKLYSQKSS